jgi:hypothetical protein
MKKNANGYDNARNTEKFTNYLIVNEELYQYDVNCDAIDVQTARLFALRTTVCIRADERKELHWQHSAMRSTWAACSIRSI